jgi:Uma2 family endonuclease
MSLHAQPRRYTLEEYFEIERSSAEKHEYRDGEVVNVRELIAMAGGFIRHVQINTNVTTSLHNRLRSGPCRVYGNDLRIRIPRRTLWTYPDATAICGKVQVETIPGVGETATNPQVIIEVLSPSTELYDRGKKFAWYREFDTLREYVLISQFEPYVEIFMRDSDGPWAFAPYSGVATARLRSLNLDWPLNEIYEGIEFQPGDFTTSTEP